MSEEDYSELCEDDWRLVRAAGGHTYAARDGYEKEGRSLELMHRQIMKPRPDEQVDHVNGNGLDNRRPNLRVCSATQNLANAKSGSWGGTSKYRGVGLLTHYDGRNKWRARIKVDGVEKHIGVFPTELEAAKAFDRRAIKEWGEFYTPQVLDAEVATNT